MPKKTEGKKKAGGSGAENDAESHPLRLENFVPYRFRILSQAVSVCLGDIYGTQFGLLPTEYRAMVIIGRYQPLTANEVCAHSSMDKVKVSRAVSGLTRRSMISRRTDPKDKRRSFLRLTKKGQQVYASVAPQVKQVEAELLSALSATESRSLDRILSKLQAKASSMRDRISG